MRVAVVGGSIGGLCAGVALRAAGHEVDLFERREGTLSSQGAGIVVQPELLQLIEGIGGGRVPTTSCTHRRTVDADGRVSGHRDMPQRFTSWEAIHRALRGLFPADRYRPGTDVGHCLQRAGRVRLSFGDGRTDEYDLVVLADGARSRLREPLGFETVRSYAGYVAWRGTVAESDLSGALIDHFGDAFVFCDARDGGHALCYFIPGDEASTDEGSRRLNWVWYESVTEGDALDAVLTDGAGRRRDGSLPPGAMSSMARGALHARAMRVLDPCLGTVVNATREPFVQAIEDRASTRMVRGRAVLLGDAAFVVRPHTAAAAAKAAGDAMALAEALRDDPDDVDRALRSYEQRRLAYGQSLSAHGVALGRGAVAAPGTRSA